MSIDVAATVLGGLIFVAVVGYIVLRKNGKSIKVEIVDRED